MMEMMGFHLRKQERILYFSPLGYNVSRQTSWTHDGLRNSQLLVTRSSQLSRLNSQFSARYSQYSLF